MCDAAVAAAPSCVTERSGSAPLVKVALHQHAAGSVAAPRIRVALWPPVDGAAQFAATCAGWFDANGEASRSGTS